MLNFLVPLILNIYLMQDQNKKKKREQKRKRFFWDFFLGGIAGIISKTVVAPIERVKLLMQTQSENARVKVRYKGIVECFWRCVKQDGALSLWRGNGVNVIRYFPTQALSFAFKDYFNSHFVLNKETHSDKAWYLFIRIFNGGMAGGATAFVVHPLDFARTRLGVDIGKSVEQRQFRGLKDCITKTFNNEGFRGLYRGVTIAVPSVFIYRGFYFGIYDTGKELILHQKKSLLAKFIWAQCSVMLSELLAYPGDTIKRKLMMQSLKKTKAYTGIYDCFVKTVERQGYKGLWRGAYSNFIRSLGSSLCLILYDQFRKFPVIAAEK